MTEFFFWKISKLELNVGETRGRAGRSRRARRRLSFALEIVPKDNLASVNIPSFLIYAIDHPYLNLFTKNLSRVDNCSFIFTI